MGEKFKPLKIDVVQLQKENVHRKGQADPDNERLDKWSSTVLLCFIRARIPKPLSEHNRQVTANGSTMNAWLQGNSMRAM